MKNLTLLSYSLLTLLFILLVIILLLIKKYKLLDSFSVQEITIPDQILVYVPYKGSYKNIIEAVNKAKLDFLTGDLISKENSKMCRIYFDNPKEVKKGRAVVGCLVTNKKKAKDFIKENSEYKIYEFKNQNVLAVTFPYYNFLNYLSAVFRGYSLLKNKSKTNENTKGGEWIVLEIFDYQNHSLVIGIPFLKENDSILGLANQDVQEEKALIVKPKKIKKLASSKASLNKNK